MNSLRIGIVLEPEDLVHRIRPDLELGTCVWLFALTGSYWFEKVKDLKSKDVAQYLYQFYTKNYMKDMIGGRNFLTILECHATIIERQYACDIKETKIYKELEERARRLDLLA